MNKLKLVLSALFIFSLFLIFLVVGSFVESNVDSPISGTQSLPESVLQWEDAVRKEAERNDIPEAVPYLLGIIMVESGGDAETYPDIFQSSESQGWAPNTIKAPKQSIEIGVKYFANLWKGYPDYDPLNICQAYNYGGGYLSFCEKSYSLETAIAFSQKQANGKQVSYTNPVAMKLGYSYRYAYGNMFYSQLIQQYLSTSSSTTNINNTELISVALDELAEGAHLGGAEYWQWYGFSGRVEWCAVFVSYCASKANLSLEKFAYCPTGINYFKTKNLWFEKQDVQDGMIIFFDWDGDEISDHVGIVEKVVDDTVHTIEGNSGDIIAKRTYNKNSAYIMGYGISQ